MEVLPHRPRFSLFMPLIAIIAHYKGSVRTLARAAGEKTSLLKKLTFPIVIAATAAHVCHANGVVVTQ